MEERSLKILEADSTFFNKITNTLSKLLTPTKVGFNSILINMKRNNILKCYEQFINIDSNEEESRKEQIKNRYEESYSLYLESIDKYIMDSVYKKVKKGMASSFEKEALASYYNIVHLKDTEYLEYKYRKQKFLLELDYENIKNNGKDKLIQKFQNMYVAKVDGLYKGIIKNYSVKLADNVNKNYDGDVSLYRNIFSTLEEYIKNIFPIKLENEETKKSYDKILENYYDFEKYTVGKLDEREFLEKNMILLGLSRVLFTHSLPLVAAEQCYNKLLKDTRALIVNSKSNTKKDDAYKMLLELIEDYNVKLLSTKVYWDKPQEREAYKKFWNKFSKAKNSETKEILILKRELSQIDSKNVELRKFYKNKLIEFGVMKTIKVFGTLENSKLQLVSGEIKKKKKI